IVAVAGSTGSLGKNISKALLQPPYVSSFSEIRLLARSPTSDKAKELESLFAGAPARVVYFNTEDEKSVDEALKGVDIVVNALTHADDSVVDGVIRNKVKVYIPSEFGVDHKAYVTDVNVWVAKKAHVQKAVEQGGGNLKVVSIYVGLFLETGFGPWLGYDTTNNVYTAVGSSDAIITYTSLDDISNSVARLALLSADPTTAATVPAHVRISGSGVSVKQVQELVEKKSGKKITVKVVPLDEWKEGLKSTDVLKQILLAAGEGWLNYSKVNSNELVNPGESLWKWKTVEEFVEAGGISA
ncbi:NAD(P)-binding protein, partial [Sistotremastrum niveocremeum HHB9708]